MDRRYPDAGYALRPISPRKRPSTGASPARHLAASLSIRVLAPIAVFAAVVVIGILCWRERREGQASAPHIWKMRLPRLTIFG